MTNLETDELLRELIGEVRQLRTQLLLPQPSYKVDVPPTDGGTSRVLVTGEGTRPPEPVAKPAKKAASRGR